MDMEEEVAVDMEVAAAAAVTPRRLNSHLATKPPPSPTAPPPSHMEPPPSLMAHLLSRTALPLSLTEVAAAAAAVDTAVEPVAAAADTEQPALPATVRPAATATSLSSPT